MTAFTDQIALVTGAASGIGRAVALALAKAGASVAVADMSPAGAQTESQILECGGEAAFFQVDVRDSAAVETMVNGIVARFGRLDIAVNCAGIDPEVAPEPTWDEADMDNILSINVKGVLLCLKYQIAQMLKQGSGAIVNVASAAGLIGVANKPIYTASKHAVVGLTKSAALQYARQGVSINAVCPSAVDTPMLDANLDDASLKPMVADNHPIGRLAAPEDIATAILWLCSKESGYVTGHALVVDGGYTIQ